MRGATGETIAELLYRIVLLRSTSFNDLISLSFIASRANPKIRLLALKNTAIILATEISKFFDMKIRLIYAIAFALFLQGASFAQEVIVSQPPENNSLCLNFPMPIIKPYVDENKLPIVKPQSSVDYKLIIINPCATAMGQRSNSLLPVSSQPKNNGNLQLPVTPFNRNESGIVFTTKVDVTKNLVFAPKQPK